MKTITITILGMLMITGVLAYYPGETITFPNELGVENLVYTIIENSTEITNLEIEINSTEITMTLPSDMKPDSFTIVLIENQTNEVIKEIKVGGGGGGTRTIYKDRNITVIQPLFLDRNKTIEIQINNCTNETILIPEENIEPKRNFIIRFFKWIWGIFT